MSMFIVFLRFSDSKSQAGEFMEGHNAWIKSGFDDGVFLVAGSLQPGAGGGIVAQNVVTAEIVEITPAKTDGRLSFLLG